MDSFVEIKAEKISTPSISLLYCILGRLPEES